MRATTTIGILAGLAALTCGGLATAAPSQIAIAITGTPAAPKSEGDQAATATNTDGVTLTVACDKQLDCTKLTSTLTAAATKLPLETPKPNPSTAASATYTLAPGATFALFYGTAKLYTLAILAPDTAQGAKVPDAAPPAAAGTLQTLASTECQRMLLAPAAREVFVTPRGTTLTPLPVRFAESETLTVTVVGDVHLVNALQVRRKSQIRVPTGRILGEDQALPKLDAQAERLVAQAPCTTRSFTVASFAPGTGEIEITAFDGPDPTVLGSFELLVDPTYAGMFSLGAVWTPLLSPGYGVAMRGGQQIITATETGSRRMAYAFLFTPFLWDGLERDIRRPMRSQKLYEHINPSVGFLLNDPLNNLLLGATLDIQSTVLVTGGALFGHVTELDGVKVGDAFAGATADLPTHKRWKTDWFLGVSVDVRVAVKLVRTVLGTAGGS